MKPMQEIETLAIEIAAAARTSFCTLFENGERYYYCTLYTTGEGHAPSISAWSWEALALESARQAEESDTPVSTIADLIKWSYADSPIVVLGMITLTVSNNDITSVLSLWNWRMMIGIASWM